MWKWYYDGCFQMFSLSFWSYIEQTTPQTWALRYKWKSTLGSFPLKITIVVKKLKTTSVSYSADLKVDQLAFFNVMLILVFKLVIVFAKAENWKGVHLRVTFNWTLDCKTWKNTIVTKTLLSPIKKKSQIAYNTGRIPKIYQRFSEQECSKSRTPSWTTFIVFMLL